MSWLLSNRDGGLTNEEGHYKFHVNAWRGNVLNGLAVTQNSPLGMNVVVSPGNAKVEYNDYGYTLWNDANDVVPISTADPSNPRIDRIVVYIDRSETPQNIVPNNPGIPKVVAVAGTPAGSPNPPDDSTVDSAVGAGNPWFELAEVLVSAGVNTISNDKITDKRSMILVPENSVDSNALLPDSVTADKLDIENIPYGVFLVDTTNGSSINTSSAQTFKTINLSGLTVGRTYLVHSQGPTLAQNQAGTDGFEMRLDSTLLANSSVTPSTSGFQNPRMNLTGFFTATNTSHVLTLRVTANGNTVSTVDLFHRTIVISLPNPATGI